MTSRTEIRPHGEDAGGKAAPGTVWAQEPSAGAAPSAPVTLLVEPWPSTASE